MVFTGFSIVLYDFIWFSFDFTLFLYDFTWFQYDLILLLYDFDIVFKTNKPLKSCMKKQSEEDFIASRASLSHAPELAYGRSQEQDESR